MKKRVYVLIMDIMNSPAVDHIKKIEAEWKRVPTPEELDDEFFLFFCGERPREDAGKDQCVPYVKKGLWLSDYAREKGNKRTKAKAALFTIRNAVELTAFLKKHQKFCRTVVGKIKEFQRDAPRNNLEDILQPQILEQLLQKAQTNLGPRLCPLCEAKQRI